MWFWDNAHWLIWPWELWHWMSVLVISAKSKGVSDIYHPYTTVEKSHCQHFNLFFPQRWDDMRSKLSAKKRWAILLAVGLIKVSILRTRLSVYRKSFFLVSVTQIIIHQPQGGRISSYLQFHSSRFKSISNISSSTLTNTAVAGGDRSRHHKVLSPHSGVSTLSALSVVCHQVTWENYCLEIWGWPTRWVDTLLGIYFHDLVYFKLQ